jgi:hypothetical protein
MGAIVHKETQKSWQPTGFIRRARIGQGQRDAAARSMESRENEVEAVARGWDVVQRAWALAKDKRNGRWRLGLCES